MRIINFLNELKDGQKKFGEDISRIINFFLLLIVYIFGVGLTSIFAKIIKHNFLEIKINKDSKSYWSNLDSSENKIDSYYRQF